MDCNKIEVSQQINNVNFNKRFKILSYNVLIQKSWYTPFVKTDPAWKYYSWDQRKKSIIQKILHENAEIICLQQIRHKSKYESPKISDISEPLSKIGYQVVFAKSNKPGEQGQEGIAIFYKKNELSLVQSDVLYYQDSSGHLALSTTLRTRTCHIFRIVSTHFIYSKNLQDIKRQVKTLSQWYIINEKNISCFITGNFNLCYNIISHQEIIQLFYRKFYDSHQKIGNLKGTYCINLHDYYQGISDKQLKGARIDYILASKDIQILNASIIGNVYDLATIKQPSDHLPITGEYIIPQTYKTVRQDLEKLKTIFIEVTQRNYHINPKYKEFLDIFWLLPRNIKNAVYQLTYQFAIKLGIYQDNLEFGRIAFTNNTYRMETILDNQGNFIPLKLEVVTQNIIPHQVILQILKIIQQRMIIIPLLIKKLKTSSFPQFLKKFDNELHVETCNKIYGQTYKLASLQYLPITHYDYGRVSFRKNQGWDVDDNIRINAMKNVQIL